MARSKAVVKTYPQLKDLVEKIVRKYPRAFEDVDPSRMIYLESDSKHSKRVAKIGAIKVPHSSITPFKFSITVFAAFKELDEPRQVLHILRELRRIEDFEGSKVGKYELQDFADIVEKYGTLWEENEDLDNPLEEEKPAVTTGIENV